MEHKIQGAIAPLAPHSGRQWLTRENILGACALLFIAHKKLPLKKTIEKVS